MHVLQVGTIQGEIKIRINFSIKFNEDGKSRLNLPPMFIQVLKSKIHRVTVTEANVDYIGSITIDPILLDD